MISEIPKPGTRVLPKDQRAGVVMKDEHGICEEGEVLVLLDRASRVYREKIKNLTILQT